MKGSSGKVVLGIFTLGIGNLILWDLERKKREKQSKNNQTLPPEYLKFMEQRGPWIL